MKIILTGATGFAGGVVLEELIADRAVGEVVVLTRRPLELTHAKVRSVVVADFTNYDAVAKDLDANACIWALGVSQTEVNREDYVKITYDYALAGLRAMLARNPEMRFCFLSGQGADQEEKARAFFGKIKGRTEKDLSALSPNVFSFRPGFIKPTSAHPSPRLMARLLKPVAWGLDRFTDKLSVDVDVLARAMIAIAKSGASERLFENSEIRRNGSTV